MKRLAIDLRMYRASGIGTFLQNLVPLMVVSGRDIDFTLIVDGDLRDRSLLDSGNVVTRCCGSPVYSVSEQFGIPGKVPRCDIFWSPHYNIPLLPVRARKRVVTIHDVFHLAFSDRLSLPQRFYAALMINSAVRLSDKVITVSEFSKSEIVRFTGVREDRIEVVYNGIDRNSFRVIRDSSPIKAVGAKYGLPERFVLYVGNVKPHKNLVRLLRAFERLTRYGVEDHGLVVVGKKEGFITGDEEIFRMLKCNADLEKRVLFTGYVENEELPLLYNSASLFVFPSLYEGFGLPPLEAMACGCPTVVSSAASLPEVCGDAAYYVDPHDVDSIADGMRRVLTDDDLRRRLVAKGHERVARFSWESAAGRILRLFEEVLES